MKMKRFFSIILTLCMVLSMLTGTTLAVDTVTVTAEVPADWTAAYCYSWGYDVGGPDWPGVAMTQSGDVWTVEIPANCDWVIINNGSGIQTIDLVITHGRDAYIILGDTESGSGKYKATVYQGDDLIQDDENKSVPDGKYVIVCDSHNVALSSVYTGFYNSAIDVSVENGVLTGYGDTEIWTITNNADGTICISINGQNLAMGDSFSSMPLGEKNDKWILEDAGNGLVYFKNVARECYIQYYANKNNWCGYTIKAGTENLFALRLYSAEPNYYVTGSSDVFSNWSECNQDGKMTEQDGIYIKKFTGVPQGDYQIKVNVGTWNNSWGDNNDISGNYCFDVPWNDATVIVKFDPATETISTEVRRPAVALVPELSDGYYEIYNADQLYWFAEQVNSGNTSINGKLMADIVVNENVLTADGELNGDGSNFRVWTPIGNDSKNYSGTFDGNGKTVSGLYFNDTSKNHVGLFGYVSYGAVRNVGVLDSYFSGDYNVGGVAGEVNPGIVTDCYNTGNVSGNDCVGGVVGDSFGEVGNSFNTGNVSGNNWIGGVTGYNLLYVYNCCNFGNVRGSQGVGGMVGFNNCIVVGYNIGNVSGDDKVGGVVGMNYGTVENSYNIGSINGSNRVGGVVGYIDDSTIGDFYNFGIVSNSYNIGSVSGSFSVGGVAGYIFDEGTVSNSYNTGSVSGEYFVGGVIGNNIENGTVTSCYYLNGCAKDGSHKIQFGIGCEAQGSNLRDTLGITTGKSSDAFASGEVAYLLQGEQTKEVWGQGIGAEKYPTLGGEKVYRNQVGNCDGQVHYEYSNWKSSPVEGHWWERSITVAPTCTEPGVDTYACVICGEVEDTSEIYPPRGHYYHSEVTALPTCTEYGIVTHTCTVCGHTYTDSKMEELDSIFWTWLADFDLCDQDPFMTVLLGLQNRLNPMYHLGCDWSYKCIKTMPAEEFEAEVDRRIALNDTLLAQIRSYFGYDEQTQTYNFSHAGGWGGAIYDRAYMGYVDNGDTYTVFFENRELEPLPEEANYIVEAYLEAYWNGGEEPPITFTYNGKVYEDLGCWEYYHVVSYTGTGNRYEVEYDGNIVRILSWDTYGPEDKPAEFDKGVYPDLNPTGHNWIDATCAEPKTCTVCGATTGTALGHNWIDATCTSPKTCTVCGLTEGKKLGHIEKIVTPGYAATYDAPGLTDYVVCDRCGITLEQQLPIATLNEEITFSYKAYGINGSTNAVNSGYITVEIWMNVNTDIARVWGMDLDMQFNENLTLLSVDGGIFQQSLSTPLSVANRDKAVKLTQDMGYSGDKTFQKGQYLFATLTFKVDKAFYGQDASFIINLDECAMARDDYANELNADFGSGTAIHVSMLGDANLDGKITTADAMSLSRWFASADMDDYEAVFDLNKDGYIDGDDFALLRGAIVRDNSYLDI